MKCNIHLNKFHLDFHWFRNARFSTRNKSGLINYLWDCIDCSFGFNIVSNKIIFCQNVIDEIVCITKVHDMSTGYCIGFMI